MATVRPGRSRSILIVGAIALFGIVVGLLAGQALIDRPVGGAASPTASPSDSATPPTSSTAAPSHSSAPGVLPDELRDATWLVELEGGFVAGVLGGPTLELPAHEIGLAGKRGLVVSAATESQSSVVFVRDIASGEVLTSFDVDFMIDRAILAGDSVFVTGHAGDRDAGLWRLPLEGGEAIPLVEGDASMSNPGRPSILISPSDNVVGSSLCVFDECVTDVADLRSGARFRLEGRGGLYLLADEYVVLIDNRVLRALSFDGEVKWSREFDGDIFGGLALDGNPSVLVTWQDGIDDRAAYRVLEISPDGSEREISVLTGPDAVLRLNGPLSVDGFGVLMPGYTMDEAVSAGFVRILEFGTGTLAESPVPVTR